jgi:hypothetical protein
MDEERMSKVIEAEFARLRGIEVAARSVVNALNPPAVVHIGSRCNKYTATYEASYADPIKVLASALDKPIEETDDE